MKNIKKYKIFLYLFFIFVVPIFLSHQIDAATYYIAPDKDLDGSNPDIVGSDSYAGTSDTLISGGNGPWKNFTKAWQVMIPGDTLILLDGIYYQSLGPRITGATESTRITIKAQNDGQAIIDGDTDCFTPQGCDGEGNLIPVDFRVWLNDSTRGGYLQEYYLVEGIVARNSTYAVFQVNSSHNIFRRVSGYNANTHDNAHVILMAQDTSDNVFEDCVAAGTGRKMILSYASEYNTVRRCVAYWQWWEGQLYGGWWGQTNAVEMYNSSYGKIENNIALGPYLDAAFNILSNKSTTISPKQAINNMFLGNMAISNGVYPDGTIWRSPLMRPQVAVSGATSEYWQWGTGRGELGMSAWGQEGTNPNPAEVSGNTIKDMFIWGGAGLGMYGLQHVSIDNIGNNTLDHLTIINNGIDNYPVDGGVGTDAYLDDTIVNTGYTSLYSSITNSKIHDTYHCFPDPADPIKKKCQHEIDQFNGEGARLQYRYIDAVLKDGSDGTAAQPLWPWSMENRILTETGIDVTGETTDTLIDQGIPTGRSYKSPIISPQPPRGSPYKNEWGVVYLSGPISVTLTKPAGAPIGSTIHYTLDGSEPTNSSNSYTSVLSIQSTTLLKATLFDTGGTAISHTRSAYYHIDSSKSNEAPEVTADIVTSHKRPLTSNTVEVILNGLPEEKNQVDLYGTAEDFTYPNGTSWLTTTWSIVSGPSNGITIANINTPRTKLTYTIPGTYVLRLTAGDGQKSSSADTTLIVYPTDMQGIVFPIPGRVEAENYKSGGAGVAYFQNHRYGDVLYRQGSHVDIDIAYNTEFGYAINNVNAGEWYAYAVNIPQPGTYSLIVSAACGQPESSGGCGTFHVEIGNSGDISGPIKIPFTEGNRKTYTTLVKQVTVPSSATGPQEMRIVTDTNASGRTELMVNLNYIEFTTPSSTTPGDLNKDNTVNIQDIIILINEIFTPNGVQGSDINDDGKVDILDVIALINIIFL